MQRGLLDRVDRVIATSGVKDNGQSLSVTETGECLLPF